MTDLIFATLAFVGGHLVLSFPALREPVRAKIGERPFQGLYSLMIIAAFVWMVSAYADAPRPELWQAPIWVRHLPLSLMLPIFIAMVAAMSPRNPAFIYFPKPPLEAGPYGIFRITRHPLMWSAGLWALLHVAANGDSASAIFFGGLAVLALFGPLLTEARRRHEMGAAWESYAAQSSYIPFAAQISGRSKIIWREIGWLPVIGGAVIYGALMVLHQTFFGVAPARFLEGIFG
ncbi:MAG: NnrU family protein [Rhodospirillales bacterium]|nr:NnrU family protein [Rhodospirillales bacterium]